VSLYSYDQRHIFGVGYIGYVCSEDIENFATCKLSLFVDCYCFACGTRSMLLSVSVDKVPGDHRVSRVWPELHSM